MSQKKEIVLHVEGMDCANCATGITSHLKRKGIQKVHTEFSTGEVTFELVENSPLNISQVINEIHKIGYKVVEPDKEESKGLSAIEKKFYFSLIFTIPLMAHMFLPFAILHNPIFQMLASLPVIAVGGWHFGKSAFNSLKTGVPNMDVLIIIGVSSAFIYSLIGTIQHLGTHEVHNYLFFETSASIVSLVLLGNVIEHKSVKQTTTALKELNKLKPELSKKVTLVNNEITSTEEIKSELVKIGDYLLVNTGDKIPTDAIIHKGSASINEAMITGESLPIEKKENDIVIGGSINEQGTIIIKATAIGSTTVLAQIIEMVKKAQQNKPTIQKLGDKVSAIFVPAVVGISLLTFFIAYFAFSVSLQQAIMQSIAVLVISCPCAMGLATPTAVMAGIGRAAKNGILIKGGQTLEQLAKIEAIVFDKTGTITTGNFKIKEIKIVSQQHTQQQIINYIFSLEQFSSHPIAKSLSRELNDKAQTINLSNINEEKGVGIMANDNENFIKIGKSTLNEFELELQINNTTAAYVSIEDELKDDVKKTIVSLKQMGIKTIMLSGDKKEKCEAIGTLLGFDEIVAEQKPAQKLQYIEDLAKHKIIAMVGDGVNDAPALTKASVGISITSATQAAMDAAQIILLNKKSISSVEEVILISKLTLRTIKQNLFWAFFYNVVAIPIAAVGLLSPLIGAMSMAFSDVVVIGNSIWLKSKKLN